MNRRPRGSMPQERCRLGALDSACPADTISRTVFEEALVRIKFLLLALVLGCSIVAHTQSTLSFPLLFSPADLASTGFAVVNPGSSVGAVTFTLYNTNGGVVATSVQSIAAAGQNAKLGTELFPSPTQAGWVQA